MQITMLKSKIHRATVSDANLNYIGSITIDEELLKAANIYENERVEVLNINNGERFATYAIKGKKGEMCLNGAAARLAQIGDIIIVVAYALIDERSAADLKPKIVHVNEKNEICEQQGCYKIIGILEILEFFLKNSTISIVFLEILEFLLFFRNSRIPKNQKAQEAQKVKK